MEWWLDESSDSVQLGDETMEVLQTALDSFKSSYERELGRPPTLKELTRTLELVLHQDADKYVGDCAALEIRQISIRTSPRKRRQTYKIGDFFAFPMPEHVSTLAPRYGFGRILETKGGTLVAVFDMTSEVLMLPKALAGQKLLFPPVTVSMEGFLQWRWRVLGGHSEFSREDYPVESFRYGDEKHGWRMSVGTSERRATWDEVKDLEEPMFWSVQDFEDRFAAMKELIALETILELLRKGAEALEQGRLKEASSNLGRAFNYSEWIPDKEGRALHLETIEKLRQVYRAEAEEEHR